MGLGGAPCPEMDPSAAALWAAGTLLFIAAGTAAASPDRKGWHTLNTERDGTLSHAKTLATATWGTVAYIVLYSVYRAALSEWLLIAFAALGSGSRLASKFLSMRAGAATPAPVDPDPVDPKGGG